MIQQIEDLKKFLKLEIHRKYDNRSIVGGFQKLLPKWTNENASVTFDDKTYQAIINFLREYEKYSTQVRKLKVDEILKLLIFYNKEENNKIQNKTKNNMISENKSNYAPISNESSKSKGVNSSKIGKMHHVDLKINSSLRSINLVGKNREKALNSIGINSIEDLLYFFPRKYEDFRILKSINQLEFGDQVTIIASVKSISSRKSKNRQIEITEVILEDGTGTLRVSFFNQPFLSRQLKKAELISVKGKVESYLGRLVMNSPSWELVDPEMTSINCITPVYKVPSGFSQKSIRKIIQETLLVWGPQIKDYMPFGEIQASNLMDLSKAIIESHIPTDFETLEKAKYRISFDQIFFLQMGVLSQKKEWNKKVTTELNISESFLSGIYSKIPFQLTNAQLSSIDDIRKDFISGRLMNRLIQGDVGSGKTLVAFVAISMILTRPGTQCAFMAPTSILADQHFKKGLEFFEKMKLINSDQIALLIGDTPIKEKEFIKEQLISGNIRLLFGTHALIEDPVYFNNLRLAIIDEQHRFGVEQRKKLIEKGPSSHLLVMTATPIPRSLALTVYGDLDLSVMDEMPLGRKPIMTQIVNPNERERVYRFIKSNITNGNQAFIIYPLVESQEEVENEETSAAVNEHKRLSNEIFPGLKVALLHGKMKSVEKENIMKNFGEGQCQILVSTSVVEVGVDIPNANIIMIEGANRFGLAQLHQLRGRVGRGNQQSYCFLIPETEDSIENERLNALQKSNDGFELAEIDLKQRGPGEFLGQRQSGFKDLTLMNIMNVKLIEKARLFAEKIFSDDPDLIKSENQEMKKFLHYYWNQSTGDMN
ncbi:MAG: ATP-dependent DNA helicase RecG [Anaerolineaceae bacterium]